MFVWIMYKFYKVDFTLGEIFISYFSRTIIRQWFIISQKYEIRLPHPTKSPETKRKHFLSTRSQPYSRQWDGSLRKVHLLSLPEMSMSMDLN